MALKLHTATHEPGRGDVPVTSAMEVLQQGYLHAVVAAAGCTLSSPSPDRGFDWHINHASASHVTDTEVDLKIALKSTTTLDPNPTGADFSFTLEDAHFQKLSVPEPTINRVLVVMIVPREMRHWIRATGDCMELKHCCYWVNLAGHAVGGSTSTTVRVKTDHVFDDVALCKIMSDIGQGKVPR